MFQPSELFSVITANEFNELRRNVNNQTLKNKPKVNIKL